MRITTIGLVVLLTFACRGLNAQGIRTENGKYFDYSKEIVFDRVRLLYQLPP